MSLAILFCVFRSFLTHHPALVTKEPTQIRSSANSVILDHNTRPGSHRQRTYLGHSIPAPAGGPVLPPAFTDCQVTIPWRVTPPAMPTLLGASTDLPFPGFEPHTHRTCYGRGTMPTFSLGGIYCCLFLPITTGTFPTYLLGWQLLPGKLLYWFGLGSTTTPLPTLGCAPTRIHTLQLPAATRFRTRSTLRGRGRFPGALPTHILPTHTGTHTYTHHGSPATPIGTPGH